jgi:hypothetical protein
MARAGGGRYPWWCIVMLEVICKIEANKADPADEAVIDCKELFGSFELAVAANFALSID